MNFQTKVQYKRQAKASQKLLDPAILELGRQAERVILRVYMEDMGLNIGVP